MRQKVFLGVGMCSLVMAVFAAPVAAQSPKLVMVTKVQNTSTNSVLADANIADEAIVAKPGHILRYVIDVRAEGGVLQQVKLTDTLPAGVELVGDAKKRDVADDLGTVTDKVVTREYKVKVTSTENGTILDNKACLTHSADTNPVCDTAKVKVNAPAKPAETPKNPTPTPAPTPAPGSDGKTDLPESGPGALGAVIGTGAFGYALHMYYRSKRELIKSLFSKNN